MKKYRRNKCISEPETAFKVDGRDAQTNINEQLLALCTSGWSVECIGRPWNVTLIITPCLSLSLLIMLIALSATCCRQCTLRVVWNFDSFERELSRYAYDAICLQYRDIRPDAMYRAITIQEHANKL